MRARRLLEPQISSLVDHIVSGCALLDGGDGDVHDLRTDCRRVRSILRAYAPLFEDPPARRTDADLRRLMELLGTIRDADVARDLLMAMDPDARDECDALQAASELATAGVRTWLASDDGRHAIARLTAFAETVPWTRRARRSATKVVARTLVHEQRRIQRRSHRARHTHRGDGQDRRLHSVRRAVKRANDASAACALDPAQLRCRTEWREAQDVLGRHHDLVVLREELRRYEADEREHLTVVNSESESAHAAAMRTLRRLDRTKERGA